MCLFCIISATSPSVSSWNNCPKLFVLFFLMATLRTWGGAPFPIQACLSVVMQGLQKQETQSPSCSILSFLWPTWPPSVLYDCSLTNVSSLISTASDSFVIIHYSKSQSLWSNNALIALYAVSDKSHEICFSGSDIENWK